MTGVEPAPGINRGELAIHYDKADIRLTFMGVYGIEPSIPFGTRGLQPR